jgi:hypothetical protein
LEEYDVGARTQDPQTGRFYQIDPMGAKYYDWSPYGFVRDNPILRVDPTGKWDITVHVYNDREKYGYGVAILTDRHGKEIYRWKVRAEGVCGRDRAKYGGDTPLGVYDIPNKGMWKTGGAPGVKDPRMAYGPNPRLILNPESGEIVTTHRNEIRMHGGRQEEKDEETGEYTPLDNPTLQKTHGCLRAFDDDMEKVKDLTDNLMADDDQEYGGKLTVVDDLVKHDDGQYLPPGEGEEEGSSSAPPTITVWDPATFTFRTIPVAFDFEKQWKEMIDKMAAMEELKNEINKNQPPKQPQ